MRGLVAALLLRMLGAAGLLVGASVLLQALVVLAPGDPIDRIPDGEALRPALMAEWQLDRPPAVQIAGRLGRALHGDLGTSLAVRPGAPVAALAAEAAARSAKLLFPAWILAIGSALLLAAWSAGRSSRVRLLVQALSVPPVFLAAWAVVSALNAGTWALLEAGAIARPTWFALPDQPSPLRQALAVGVLAVASGTLFELHSAFEAEITRIRRSPFLEAARALGLPTWPRLLLHLVPVSAALAASRMAALVGGLVVVEKVLLLGGAGALLWEAALQRDDPLAFALGLVAAGVVVAARLGGDLVRVLADPRLREPA